MAAYFIVQVKIPDAPNRQLYNDYIQKVKPIVESYGGIYMIRSEHIESWAGNWRPDRVIVIQFPDKSSLHLCFDSKDYQSVKSLREMSVETQAIVVED